MRRPPRDAREPLLKPAFIWMISWQAGLIAAATLTAFHVALRQHGTSGSLLRNATTVAFMTLALAQVFHAYSTRSQRRSALLSSPFSNPWLWSAVVICLVPQWFAIYWAPLGRLLHTVPLAASDWLLILVCSLAPAIAIEVIKFIRHLMLGDN